MDWESADEALIDFTSRLIALRKSHVVLRRRRFMHGHKSSPDGYKDVTWLHPEGREMADEDWHDGHGRCLALMLYGTAAPDIDPFGNAQDDTTLLVLVNAAPEPRSFRLPQDPGGSWRILIDTAEQVTGENVAPGSDFELEGRHLLVLEHNG
jgi:glycogen operon protein